MMNLEMFFLILLLKIENSDTQTIGKYHMTVEYGTAAPDNYINPTAILINGQFPGPTIRCKPFDTLIVYVENLLEHGFAMHWHGLHERTSKNADGVPGVTQHAIAPNSTYKYVINVNGQHGTYAYHAHNRLDVIWCFGVIIIDDTDILHKFRINYDYDKIISVSQCWHANVQQFYDELMSAPLRIPPPEDEESVLINGHSYGIWPTSNGNTDGYEVITVNWGDVCRFRFIGFTDDRACVCYIESHNMTVFESDGTITELFQTSYIQLNVLQRYSALVHFNQTIGNYLIRCMLTPGSGADNGVAVLHYYGAHDPKHMRKNNGVNSVVANQTFGKWILEQIPPQTPQRLVYRLPKLDDVCKEIVINSSFVLNTNGSVQFLINNQSLITDLPVTYLSQIDSGVNISNHSAVFTLNLDCIYLFIFQNLAIGPICEQHPFHLHGLTFYVIGYGSDKYNPDSDRAIIENNIRNNRVEFRDVFTLFANTTNVTNIEYCGWTAILFVANNAGVWLSHCHITAHMIVGKQFLVYIKPI